MIYHEKIFLLQFIIVLLMYIKKKTIGVFNINIKANEGQRKLNYISYYIFIFTLQTFLNLNWIIFLLLNY